jgi:hypothetical protein
MVFCKLKLKFTFEQTEFPAEQMVLPGAGVPEHGNAALMYVIVVVSQFVAVPQLASVFQWA